MMSDDTAITPDFRQQANAISHAWSQGESSYKDTLEKLDVLLEEARSREHRADQAFLQTTLGYVHGYRGNLPASIQHYRQARQLYEQIGDAAQVAISELNQAINYQLKGDFAEALRLFRAVQAQTITEDMPNLRAMAATNEGLLYIAQGRYPSARRALEKAQALVDNHESEFNNNWATIYCELYYGHVRLLIEDGKAEDAWSLAVRSRQIAQEHGGPLHLGYAERSLALVIDALGKALEPAYSDYPDQHFKASIEAFRAIRADAEVARTTYMQAISLGKRGQRATAARKLQQVLVMFTRLGMVDDAARAAQAQLSLL